MTCKTETTCMLVNRFIGRDGKPTCSIGTNKNETCIFYMQIKLGTRETCYFLENKQLLERGISTSGVIGAGYLIPHCKCPVWNSL